MGKKYICFISGDKIDLAVISREYSEFLLQLLNNPPVRHYLANRYPILDDNIESIIKDNLDKKEITLIIIDKSSDNPAGFIKLDEFSLPNGRAMITIALMPEFQNMGLGREATNLLIKYAFNTLGLRKLCLEVYAFNKNAVKMYKSLGFVIEGEYKNHSLKDGEYHTLIFMSLLKK
ncbi:GNAT family N-acetyltransferase [candidate division WOR-3 bacterium]|nr:GNAT family N-acetyltransferase [candidate division WOR-3 bacterium]